MSPVYAWYCTWHIHNYSNDHATSLSLLSLTWQFEPSCFWTHVIVKIVCKMLLMITSFTIPAFECEPKTWNINSTSKQVRESDDGLWLHRMIKQLYVTLVLGRPWGRSGYSDWLRAGRSGDRMPVGAKFSAPVQTGPGDHPASCTMGTGSFRGVKSGRGVTLTPHHLLVPWSWKGRAIPLIPLWTYGLYRASVPVQGCTLPYLSACTRVHFTLPQCLYKGALYLNSVPV